MTYGAQQNPFQPNFNAMYSGNQVFSNNSFNSANLSNYGSFNHGPTYNGGSAFQGMDNPYGFGSSFAGQPTGMNGFNQNLVNIALTPYNALQSIIGGGNNYNYQSNNTLGYGNMFNVGNIFQPQQSSYQTQSYFPQPQQPTPSQSVLNGFSTQDAAKIAKKADMNNDGQVSESEMNAFAQGIQAQAAVFNNAGLGHITQLATFMSQAFSSIAGVDGNASSITKNDLLALASVDGNTMDISTTDISALNANTGTGGSTDIEQPVVSEFGDDNIDSLAKQLKIKDKDNISKSKLQREVDYLEELVEKGRLKGEKLHEAKSNLALAEFLVSNFDALASFNEEPSNSTFKLSDLESIVEDYGDLSETSILGVEAFIADRDYVEEVDDSQHDSEDIRKLFGRMKDEDGKVVFGRIRNKGASIDDIQERLDYLDDQLKDMDPRDDDYADTARMRNAAQFLIENFDTIAGVDGKVDGDEALMTLQEVNTVAATGGDTSVLDIDDVYDVEDLAYEEEVAAEEEADSEATADLEDETAVSLERAEKAYDAVKNGTIDSYISELEARDESDVEAKLDLEAAKFVRDNWGLLKHAFGSAGKSVNDLGHDKNNKRDGWFKKKKDHHNTSGVNFDDKNGFELQDLAKAAEMDGDGEDISYADLAAIVTKIGGQSGYDDVYTHDNYTLNHKPLEDLKNKGSITKDEIKDLGNGGSSFNDVRIKRLIYDNFELIAGLDGDSSTLTYSDILEFASLDGNADGIGYQDLMAAFENKMI